MRITKYLHSCLLIESKGEFVLIDPGTFSTPLLDIKKLERIDKVLITHEHFDHFDSHFVKNLAVNFRSLKIFAPPVIVRALSEDGVKVASYQSTDTVTVFPSPHEGHPPFLTPPEQAGFHYKGILTHPGDSHSLAESRDVLALPIAAPWGSTDRAVQLALNLKPKYILPIHDWHWKDDVRKSMYGRLKDLFAEQGIEFFELETGKPIIIDKID